jgi:AraC-like DNA-binding protein
MLQPLDARIYQSSSSVRFHFDCLFPQDKPETYRFLMLYQTGDLHARQRYRIGQHVQYCHEISYIESGSGEFAINGKWFPVRKGDVIVTRKGDVHDGISNDDNPFRMFYIGFDFVRALCDNLCYSSMGEVFEQISSKKFICHNLLEIEPFFVGICRELINRRVFYKNYVACYAEQLILCTSRALMDDNQRECCFQCDSNINDQIVYQIIQYIDINMENISSLSNLSQKLGYSYSHLSNVFKKKLGISIYQFYNEKRFGRAAELLRTELMTISDIAFRLNYQSLHAFSKAFRNYFGVSPSKYRNLYKLRKEMYTLYKDVKSYNEQNKSTPSTT